MFFHPLWQNSSPLPFGWQPCVLHPEAATAAICDEGSAGLAHLLMVLLNLKQLLCRGWAMECEIGQQESISSIFLCLGKK